MEQIPGTTPGATAPEAQQDGQAPAPEPPAQPDGFRARGRMRRRARFLRGARELAYRDLGGLVFNLHRFGRRNDELVLTKLSVLARIDDELRALEAALHERESVTILREAGIIACPRCAAIHAGEDRYCPNCGLSTGRHADLPIAGPAAPGPATQPTATQPTAPPPAPGPPPAPAGGPDPVAAPAPGPPTEQHDAARPAVPVASPTPGAPAPATVHPPAQVGRSPAPPVAARGRSAQEPVRDGATSTETPGEQTEILRPPAGAQ